MLCSHSGKTPAFFPKNIGVNQHKAAECDEVMQAIVSAGRSNGNADIYCRLVQHEPGIGVLHGDRVDLQLDRLVRYGGLGHHHR